MDSLVPGTRCPSWLPVMWLPDRRKLSLPSAMLGRLHCISWIAWTMIVLELVRAHMQASLVRLLWKGARDHA